uniref:Uncharacterized protein n=1 Tax=Lotharella oceanica TaxID=641309 RepID=A0A7S2XF96_9EUKA|mmetsp:Transcript_37577/g.69277  ORF Transcript_37577/g.69277 Transcript_37577/m.69277 type:complete len:574 (+) Transcript_37577:133-1854(+)
MSYAEEASPAYSPIKNAEIDTDAPERIIEDEDDIVHAKLPKLIPYTPRDLKLLDDPDWRSLQSCVYGNDWKALFIQWGVPLFIVCNAASVGTTQVVTNAYTNLQIKDNNEDILNDQVKSYSNVENVRMTFNAGANLLGMLIGWSSLVWPHVVHGLLLIFWLLPMPRHWRHRFLNMLSQMAKMVWAGAANEGISVIAFGITIIVDAALLHENVTLELYSSLDKLANLQTANFILMILAAQGMLYFHRYTDKPPRIEPASNSPYFPATDDDPTPDVKGGWEENPESPPLPSPKPVTEKWKPLVYRRGDQGMRGHIVYWFGTFALFLITAVCATSATYEFATIEVTGVASTLDQDSLKEVVPLTFPRDGSRKLGGPAQVGFTAFEFAMLFLVIPGLVSLTALVLWVCPAPRHWQEKLLLATECLSAWSCFELWFLTSAIALHSLKIVCDALLADIEACAILSTHTGFVCFSVKGNLSENAWWMILFALLQRFSIFFVLGYGRNTLYGGDEISQSSISINSPLETGRGWGDVDDATENPLGDPTASPDVESKRLASSSKQSGVDDFSPVMNSLPDES